MRGNALAALRPGAVTVAAAAVAAVAAVVGGAFFPGPRLVVGVLFAVVAAGVVGVRPPRPEPCEWTVMTVLVWAVAVGVLNPVAPLAAKETIVVWLVAVLLWVAARRCDAGSAELALVVLLGAAVWLSVAIVVERVVVGTPRPSGLLENPNVAAFLLLPLVPVVLGQGRPRRATAAVLVLVLVAVGLTGSRAALLAAAAAVVLLLPRGRRRMLGAAGAGVVAAAALAWRFTVQSDPMAWLRLSIWRALGGLALDHPLVGVGPGGLADSAGVVRLSHPEMLGLHQRLASYAETSPLAVLLQLGIPGLALVLLAVVLWLAAARRRGVLAVPAARATLVAMAVVALLHDLTGVDVVLWWWALLVGLVERRKCVRPVALPGTRGLAVQAGAIALAGLVLWGMAGPAWARLLWSRGDGSPETVARAMRAEPWYSAPPEWRVAVLLNRPAWTWEQAAEAVWMADRAAAVHPGSASLWAGVARVHARVVMELGRWPASEGRARTAYEMACAREPLLPWYWTEWAQLEHTLGDQERARALAERAVAVEPAYVRGWLLLARIELDAGRRLAARAAAEAAAEAVARGRGRLLTRYERELLALPGPMAGDLAEALE